jgi:hypothetical protein
MKELKNEKSPAPHGFMIKFNKQMWHVVSSTYLKMCQEAIKGGRMGNLVNVSLVKIIPKGIKRYLMGMWHLITPMNVSYKILAKSLSRRICLLVARIFHKEKIAFIKGMFIMDNIITTCEDLEWVRETGKKALLLKNDFDKACDRIEWDFILDKLD